MKRIGPCEVTLVADPKRLEIGRTEVAELTLKSVNRTLDESTIIVVRLETRDPTIVKIQSKALHFPLSIRLKARPSYWSLSAPTTLQDLGSIHAVRCGETEVSAPVHVGDGRGTPIDRANVLAQVSVR